MLFLIRHAHAVPADEDPLRPLSLRGVDECTRLVRFFRTSGALVPLQFWHSPLVRSRDTADRLAAGLAPDAIRVEIPGLLPEDDPEPLARRVDALPPKAMVAIVGHEPHLGHLVTLLTRGKAKPVIVELRKAAALSLERSASVHPKSGFPRWRLRWLVSPELLRSQGDGEFRIAAV
ncbi:MAG: hypothetical protein JNN01_16345 [Opitutaceae bacterium]|nr:hypothetical protein [Opitutaceae bacterium]